LGEDPAAVPSQPVPRNYTDPSALPSNAQAPPEFAQSTNATDTTTTSSSSLNTRSPTKSLKNYLPNRSGVKTFPSLAATLPLSFSSSASSPFPPLGTNAGQYPAPFAPTLVTGAYPPPSYLSSRGLPPHGVPTSSHLHPHLQQPAVLFSLGWSLPLQALTQPLLAGPSITWPRGPTYPL
jgi:hypothetical protein